MDTTTRPRREPTQRIKPDPIDPRGRAMEVIDTDFHFQPEWDDIRKYLKEPFRTKLTKPPAVGGDYGPAYALDLEGTGQDTQGRARTAVDILRAIDEIGVDTVIVSPGFQRPQSMFHQAAVSAVSTAYNDLLIEEVLPASPRIKAEIMINHRNPVDGRAEICRVGEHPGFVSVYTEFGGNYEPLGSAKHDPIFSAAVERDLVVTSHVGTFWQQFTPLHQGARTWTEMFGVAGCGIAMSYVASMVMQGLFDKWPELRVIVKEGGFWWLAEFETRADEFYMNHPHDIQLAERKIELGEKYLRKMPSEYLSSNIRFSSQPMCIPRNPEHFKSLMEVCRGEDMLLYSSDWPHATFDPLNWVFSTSAISESGRRKILADNAKNWFKRLS
jgi:predicted TIM-barrel fold metal-dependent hydrolase